MAKVFISWGSSDAPTVERLYERLRELGVELFEYTHDMAAGDQISDRVSSEIQSADAVIICLSDLALARPWIQTEIAWCFDGSRPRKPVLPVRVGPLAEGNVPLLLRTGQRYIFDLTRPGGADDDLLKLCGELLAKLGRKAPQVIPAALFAMTREQSEQLFAAWQADAQRYGPKSETLGKLCALLGMPSPPALFELLSRRYGDSPEAFAPFHPDRPLLGLFQEALKRINAERAAAGLRPLYLRWVNDEVTIPGPANRALRDQWRTGDSLLVIDSISILHDDIAEKFGELPHPEVASRSALLWIPPYTQTTAGLEEHIGSVAGMVGVLGDAFTDLERQLRRPMAFDVATSLALRVWLLRALGAIPDEAEPLAETVGEMSSRGLRPGTLLNPRAA